MKMKIFISIFSLFFIVLSVSNKSVAQVATVHGHVVNATSGAPIPQLTLYLVHPTAGRSGAHTTDEHGEYIFSNVPIKPDNYYLEIYWGKTLMYRSEISIKDHIINIPNIRL